MLCYSTVVLASVTDSDRVENNLKTPRLIASEVEYSVGFISTSADETYGKA